MGLVMWQSKNENVFSDVVVLWCCEVGMAFHCSTGLQYTMILQSSPYGMSGFSDEGSSVCDFGQCAEIDGAGMEFVQNVGEIQWTR